MKAPQKTNFILGIVAIGFAAILIVIWVPLDVETGLTEKIRRRVVIGDALAPTFAGIFVALGGLGLLLFERNATSQPIVDRANLVFLTKAFVILVIALTIMRWAGPLAVALFNWLTGSELEYRLLRDTVPWKYLGYLVGGWILISGLIAVIEHRISSKAVLIGLVATLVMIAIYDLPFEDLLLPPNGDV